jgi:PHP family Zn ribbon phosphoesterase
MCNSIGDNMTKVKQEDFERFVNEVAQAINFIGSDLGKVQTIMYNLLDELGKLEKPTCVNCETQLMIPIVKNIIKNENCPYCGENIYGSEQPTFVDWDAGTVAEEE